MHSARVLALDERLAFTLGFLERRKAVVREKAAT
jgi:hypothetical protein